MSTQVNNNLKYQYDWFQRTFPPVLQGSFDDFFAEDFTFTLLGVCQNVNSLIDKDAYFVTKIKLDEQHDIFFRFSETAIRMVLDKSLGRSNGAFNLSKLTELETKVITAFNDGLYRAVVKHLQPPPPTLTRTNFDVVFLTFVLTDNETGKAGRFVVALPDVLVAPEEIAESLSFPVEHFEQSVLSVKLRVGSTVFKLHDVKNLEVGDMVIFEDSNIEKMQLSFKDYETEVLLNPRLSLVIHVDDDGGLEMPVDNNINIWDSIEVQMVANFDAVDITLGELKKIQAGMVVDLVSIYQNKVTLTVEDKPIASGELVIVNDKYGVKITEVHAPKAKVETVAVNDSADENYAENSDGEVGVNSSVSSGIPGNEEEEEFDYSDFDLEEDI